MGNSKVALSSLLTGRLRQVRMPAAIGHRFVLPLGRTKLKQARAAMFRTCA